MTLNENENNEKKLLASGNEFLENGLYNEALEYYRKALEINPNNPETLANLGLIYGLLKDKNKEIEFYEKAIAIDPYFVRAWKLLGDFYVYSKDFDKGLEKGLEYYKKVLEFDPQNWTILNALRNPILSNEEERIKYFTKCTKILPEDEIIWFQLGDSYLKKFNYKEAINSFKKVLEYNPLNEDAKDKMDFAISQSDDHSMALKYFGKRLLVDERDKGALWGIANVYWRMKKLDLAKHYFEKGLEFYPKDEAFMFNLGSIILSEGDYEVAINYFKKLIEINPDETLYWFKLAKSFEEAGEEKQAKIYFEKADEVNRLQQLRKTFGWGGKQGE